MKKPEWVTVVGIVGMVMAGLGLLGAVQSIAMPMMMDMQSSMFSAFQEEIEREQQENPENAPPEEFVEMFNKMWNTPEWYKPWSIVSGLLQALICGFILYACIQLLQMKKSAIKLFYFSVGAKIGLSLLQISMALMASSFMVVTSEIGGGVSFIIYTVILVVVATADKSPLLYATLPPPIPQDVTE